MSANSYGIIVEGTYDSAVYETIIRRVASHEVYVRALDCTGKTNLMKNFPGLLKIFEHEISGGPVDMAVVVRDADGKEPGEIEAQMRLKVEGRRYPFPLGVRFHAVRNAMDAWLLADVNAINAVALRRSGKRVTKSYASPEELLNPKEAFRRLLSEHNVDYTAPACSEVAREASLEVLSEKCPRFRIFADLVDC
jgi:hypothetical protein